MLGASENPPKKEQEITKEAEIKQKVADALQDILATKGIVLSPDQIERFTTEQILGLARGTHRINRNPVAGTSIMHDWVGPADLPANRHDYI